MKKLNYWNVKSYAKTKDKTACEQAWEKEIELVIDENGKVYNEAGQYVADAVYQDGQEY